MITLYQFHKQQQGLERSNPYLSTVVPVFQPFQAFFIYILKIKKLVLASENQLIILRSIGPARKGQTGGAFMHIAIDSKDIEEIAYKVAEILKPFLQSPEMPVKDEILDIKGLSEYSKMSIQWIYNNGKSIPRVSPTGKPLFRKSEFDAWLESRTISKQLKTPRKARGQGFKQQKND